MEENKKYHEKFTKLFPNTRFRYIHDVEGTTIHAVMFNDEYMLYRMVHTIQHACACNRLAPSKERVRNDRGTVE